VAGVLRNLRIVLGVDFNESGLKKADRALRQIDKRLGGIGRSTAIGAGLAAVTGSAQALTAALLPAAPAILALPAAMAVAKAATATFKVATVGMGDAMSAVAEGDAAKLEEALTKLSPSARAFVRSTAGLKGRFDPIQQVVQQRTFAGLAAQMGPVADNLLPGIKTGMLGVAAGFNLGAKEALKFGQTPMAKGAVNKVFASSSRIMHELGGATKPALAGVTALTVAGLPLAERMTGWAVSGTKAASAFLTSERGAAMLANAVDGAGDTLAQLGRIGGNVGGGLIRMFGQMEDSGDGVLDTVERLTAKFEAWAKTAEGQQQTAETFALLRDVVGDLGAVLPIVVGPLGVAADILTSLPGPLRDVVTQGLALALIVGPLAGKIGGVASAGLHMADGVRRMRDAAADAGGPMGALGNAATRTRSAIGSAATLLTGPWGIALAGGAAALGLFATRNDAAETQVSTLTDALVRNKGALDQSAISNVQNALETAGAYRAAQELRISLTDVTDAALGNQAAMDRVSTALAATSTNVQVYGGRAGQGAIAQKQLTGGADLLSNALHGQNDVVEEARKRFGRLTAGAPSTAAGARDVARSMTEIQTAADGAAGRTAALTAKMAGFKNLAGDADMAAIAFRDSIDGLSGALRRNGAGLDSRTGKLNIASKAGRENNRLIIEAIRNAADHSQKLLKEGKSTDVANVAFARHIDRLRGVLTQSKLSKAEIDRLIRRYASMPGDINAALGRIKNKTVTIKVRADGTVNLPGGTKASLWASGGVLPGYTPGRDPHMFYSPTGGTLGLSGGEAVMRPEWTRAVGRSAVEQMNAAARRGGVPAVKKVLAAGVGPQRLGGEGAFFADGGIIAKHSFSGFDKMAPAMARYNRKVGEAAWQAAQKITKKLNEVSLGGPGVAKALKWARGQHGKPYIWGGVGPRGYDCSGFMSAITNVIKGRRPYSRLYSTHSFGASSGPGGFVRNRKSGFMVGVTDAGVGHMAGTLGRVNVESRGSRGVVVGSAARGYSNGLFSRRYGLAKFDQGGVLPPGFTPAYNGTGKPEYVFTHKQMQSGGGARVEVHNHFHIPAHPNKHAIGKEIYEALYPYMDRAGRRLPD
jgi:hypothetical protein